MSETAKKAREAMKAKAKRLSSADPHNKVDSSSWSPSESLDADVQTGARPLVKRLYKKGGKVIGKCEGGATKMRADRKARKAGGRTNKLTPDSLINRDVRTANEAREGKKHEGGFKKGGKTGKAGGGMLDAAKKAMLIAKDPHRKTTKPMLKAPLREAEPAPMPMPEDQMIGRKKGGRTGKMGGGVMGDNPISQQNRSLSKAAGMAYKKGGKAKRERHNGSEGNVVGDDAQKDFSNLIAKSEANAKEQAIKDMIGRAQFGDKNGNIPTPPRREYKNTDELVDAYGKSPTDIKKPAPRAVPRRVMPPVDQMGNPTGMKKGGKASKMDWEHSKKDLEQDKKLAKKHGMSMSAWEKSKLDEKHDKQQSTEGLKKGGRTARYAGGGVFSGDSKSKVPGAVGGRSAHAKGGKAGKSKTNINIIIGAGGMPNPSMGDGTMPNEPMNAPPRHLPVPPPAAAMPQGGPPMPMPPAGGGAGAGGPPMPPMAMARKSGGRTIHVINHGSGGGKGRLEKIKAYGLKPAR